MEPKEILKDDRLKTPRAAAVAGIVYEHSVVGSEIHPRVGCLSAQGLIVDFPPN